MLSNGTTVDGSTAFHKSWLGISVHSFTTKTPTAAVAMQAFEEHACFKMPTLILVIVGAAMLLLSACISFFQFLAATELDPDSRDLLALAHARQVTGLQLQTLYPAAMLRNSQFKLVRYVSVLW